MSPSAALQSSIFLSYAIGILSALIAVGLLLIVLRFVLRRNVGSVVKTYVGWLFIVPVIIGMIFIGREATIVGVALMSVVGFKEFARATGLYADWWMTGVVYLGIVLVAGSSLATDPRLDVNGWYGLFMTLPVYIISLILVIPIARNRVKGALQATALAILGFVYLGWMLNHIGFLANSSNAYGYLLYLFVAVQVNDIAAFTSGKLFGRRKLRSEVSPNKTWGGSLGALAVSMVLPWLLWFSFPDFGPVELLLTGVIVGIGGQIGDLAISVIKRDIGVKDMGALIPGHGGMLDRVDSLIFTGPLFFHMVRWFQGLNQTW